MHRGHRGDVRGVRAARARRVGVRDHAQDRASTDGDFDVEDLSTAFLRLDGGGTLLLESQLGAVDPEDQCYVTVYGSDGGASIEWGAPADRPSARASGPRRTACRPTLQPDAAARRGAPASPCADFLDRGADSTDGTSHRRLAGAGPGRGRRRLLRLGRSGARECDSGLTHSSTFVTIFSSVTLACRA